MKRCHRYIQSLGRRGVFKMPYPKPCRICGKKFTPFTSQSKLCDECWKMKSRGRDTRKK